MLRNTMQIIVIVINAFLLTFYLAFQRVTLTKLETLHGEVKEVKHLVQNLISNKQNTYKKKKVSNFRLYPALPLRCEEEFRMAEEHIKDITQFKYLVKELKRIQTLSTRLSDGSTLSKIVFNILRHMISHNLALKVRLTSTSGKIAFEGTLLARAVQDAVRETYPIKEEEPTSDATINKIIGAWFRNAVDRKGGNLKYKFHDSPENDKAMEDSESNSGFH